MGTLKGLGYASRTDADVAKLNSLDLDWWYNWNQTRLYGAGKVTAPFVPMLYSDSAARLETLNTDLAALNMPTRILGFNEPDHDSQADMSTGEARAAWRALEKAAAVEGLKIGSPVTVSPDAWWMNRFMIDSTELESPDLKIDFVCAHIYQNPSVSTFLNKVDALHDRWGKPVWVTETAVADFTAVDGSGVKSSRYSRDEVNQYMEDLWAEVQKRPWLERFAWKTRDNADEQMWFSSLFNSNGTLTSTGVTYRNLTS